MLRAATDDDVHATTARCRGPWIAALPEDEREDDDVDAKRWHAQWGDRCQQIVWIGIGMDQQAITTMLDSCLLTDEEMALGPQGWAEAFDDPLPEWAVAGHDVDEGEWEEEEEGGEVVGSAH